MFKTRIERTEHKLVTDGVLPSEQTLSLQKPFWVFFSGNVCLTTWLMGVLVAGMGLNLIQATIALVVGAAVGVILPAGMAVLGPLTRLSQMECGRFSLGLNGKKLPAFLNWVSTVGWDAINNILSAAALVAFFSVFGLTSPFWLALAALVIAQLFIGMYGHHLIQDSSMYSSVILGGMFIVVALIAIPHTGITGASTATASYKDIFMAIVLMVAYNAGSWPLYSTDYTRYLPEHTSGKSIFWTVFAGLFISSILLPFFGYLTASAVVDQTPEGVMKGLEQLTGRFAPLVLLVVSLSAIPPNAINDNSGAYSLMSSGIKIARPLAALIGGLLGYFICLLAENSFIDFFENFLFLFFHWVAPFCAIILVHWLVIGKKQMVTPKGFTRGFVIFVLMSCTSVWLFSANSLYTGILSDTMGGIDVGPYIGFTVTALIYYLVLRYPSSEKISPQIV